MALIVALNAPAQAAAAARHRVVPYRYQTHQVYTRTWGIDSLSIESVGSGETLRLRYRVLDPEKAITLIDGSSEAALLDPRAGVRLPGGPVGRGDGSGRSGLVQAGGMYSVAFINEARRVLPGHRVSVSVGQFRAENLLVR
jgi:hypothetical protein